MKLTMMLVVLYLQTKDGCLHPVRAQVMLRGVPRHLRPQSKTVLAYEIISGIKSSRFNRTESLLR
jgi:hypothetical protein